MCCICVVCGPLFTNVNIGLCYNMHDSTHKAATCTMHHIFQTPDIFLVKHHYEPYSHQTVPMMNLTASYTNNIYIKKKK